MHKEPRGVSADRQNCLSADTFRFGEQRHEAPKNCPLCLCNDFG